MLNVKIQEQKKKSDFFEDKKTKEFKTIYESKQLDSPIASSKIQTKNQCNDSMEKHKKTSSFLLKKCVFKNEIVSFAKTNNIEMNDIYSRLTSEIDLHEKWILDFQNSKKLFNENIFQIFEKMICNFFYFDIKVR